MTQQLGGFRALHGWECLTSATHRGPLNLSQPATHKVAAAGALGTSGQRVIIALSALGHDTLTRRNTHPALQRPTVVRTPCTHVRRTFSRPEQTPPCDPRLSDGSTRFVVDDRRTRGFGAPLGDITAIKGCHREQSVPPRLNGQSFLDL